VAKPNSIELPDCEPMPILYEDRSVIAIDKPRGFPQPVIAKVMAFGYKFC
jgi:23S rRNA-/tRNA-specific pseudouridylate synthase